MPKNSSRSIVVAAVTLCGVLSLAGVAMAYAPENDLLKIKGYSPDVIKMADTQRSRQEWREPEAPKRGPIENAFHNIYNNNWTGSFDEFGSGIIRDY